MGQGGDSARRESGDRRLVDAVEEALARLGPVEPGLHLVATPIGNLADISLRALHLLAKADLVLCEDTRVTRRLLDRYRLAPNLLSYHEHNAAQRRPHVLERLEQGEAIALVSDAGTPLVSDPGYRLAVAAIAAGHPVHAVPGASAVLAGLAVSGQPTDRFWFEGFLPPRAAARQRRIAELAGVAATLVLFESPRRLAAALADLAAGLGHRDAAVARELTKRFETVYRAPLPDLARQFAGEQPPKGEIVIVVAPPAPGAFDADEADIDRRLAELIPRLGTREAAGLMAEETGLKRRTLYQRALRLARGDE